MRGLFTCAADIAWVFRVGGVRQLERNLTHVFASEMRRSHGSVDNRELRRRVRHCSRQGMRSYFAYFCEAMTVGARSEQQLRARIRGTGSGFDSIVRDARQGVSSLIAMGHQGNWDYAGYWARLEVAPVVTVAERLANDELLHTFVIFANVLACVSCSPVSMILPADYATSCLIPRLSFLCWPTGTWADTASSYMPSIP